MIPVFLANGFEEIEALATVDILRRAGLSVLTVGVGGRVIEGAHSICVTTDITEDELVQKDWEAVVLPGGMPGTVNLDNSAVVRSALTFAAEQDIYIAAICAAPSVLGHAGLLQGKKATCYPGFESELKGAVYCKAGVVTDDKVITASGAGVAVDFALELVRVLVSKETSDEIRKGIQCQ